MTGRPLHALLLPAASAGRLRDALAAALDGTGPAILPLDPRLPAAQVSALLAAFAPAALETQGDTQRRLPTAPVPPDVAVVIATSGSTGEPKGVQLTAAALLHSARASLGRLAARPGERWLCPLPTSHIAGLGVLVRSLVTGTDPVVTGRLGDDADLAALGCAHVSLVPAQLRRLLAAGADLAAVRTILLGGAAVPPGLLAAARAAGARVVTSYGMSETCGGCVYDGIPLAGVSVRTRDGGRIEIAGPVLFAGYRGQPGLTAAALADGWFVTSDAGAVDSAGRLTVHGRADEMINTGGEKVAPGPVAAALEQCPGVREAVVIGVPDPRWGERVTAIVVPADPADPPALPALRELVAQRLPRYAAPRALLLVPEIPVLGPGKPDLAALRRLAAAADLSS
ncbi:MAG TPA: AMP-binding protein [Streptosporangiaceae bacterium]|nr:AMP-binding protein [Streptosporangiaceae bacterium]